MVEANKKIETDLLVIGGGPGGYVAAIRGAQLGKQVTLADKSDLGGVCLNRGCIPSKALITAADFFYKLQDAESFGIRVDHATVDIAKVQEWKNGLVAKLTGGINALMKGNRINVIQGEAILVSPNEAVIRSEGEIKYVKFKNCIIATGSKPSEIGNLPMDRKKVLSSDEVLKLGEVPKRLIVIGGGYIGLELGTAYRKFGSNVTILEGTDQILPGNDPSIVRLITQRLKKLGVQVHTNTNVLKTRTKGEEVIVTAEVNGEQTEFAAEYVLVSVGRKPNTDHLGLEEAGIRLNEKGFIIVDEQMRTTAPHIYAIGDVAGGPLLAHKASYEGKIAAEVIAGHHAIADYRAIPFVIFSDPEVASVGLSEAVAVKKGYRVKVNRFPFQANGRALSMNAAEGFVQMVADAATGEILGVQIVGPEASNLISEAAFAIEMGSTAEDLALTIHPHPTLSEGIMEAAEAVMGFPIHMLANK